MHFWRHHPQSTSDIASFSIRDILAAEEKWIAQRRIAVASQIEEGSRLVDSEESQPSATDASNPISSMGLVTKGLGLSGGGIRSAIFNLGILQAFEKYRKLPRIDYLSMVSGGSYIGASLTWFRTVLGAPIFPFGTERSHYKEKLGGDMLSWLRTHGNYLAPGDRQNAWALAGAFLTASLVSLVVVFTILISLMTAMKFYLFGTPTIEYFFIIGKLILALFIGSVFIFTLFSGLSDLRKANVQTKLQIFRGFLLSTGVTFVLIGTVPIVHELLMKQSSGGITWVISSITGGGGAGLFGALTGGKKLPARIRSSAINLSLILLTYGLILGCWHLSTMFTGYPLWLQLLALVTLAIGLFGKINHVSMHRFYRNRLMDAFMPYQIASVPPAKSDQCRVKDIPASSGTPYPIINATLQTIDSQTPMLAQRGGENFIFSPLFTGSPHTAWVPTRDYLQGKMNLATAMAISGAAVDPNSSVVPNRALSFLMSLLNIRLGYWTLNPKTERQWFVKGILKKLRQHNHPVLFDALYRARYRLNFSMGFIRCLLFDLLGKGLDENRNVVHLSDGGHFENLGLYELLRRKCHCIVICDASSDPSRSFEDLAKVVSMARIDFGAAIDLPHLDRLRPEKDGISPAAFAKGTIQYQPDEQGDISTPRSGILYYIKPTIIDGLPEDIMGYFRANPAFPHESTADQFFDERQFEAYRELGYCIGKQFIKTHPEI